MEIENLKLDAYIAVHKETGEPFRKYVDVATAASTAKRRFTDTSGKGTFSKQNEFIIAQLINPVVLRNQLESIKRLNVGKDEAFDMIMDMIEP